MARRNYGTSEIDAPGGGVGHRVGRSGRHDVDHRGGRSGRSNSTSVRGGRSGRSDALIDLPVPPKSNPVKPKKKRKKQTYGGGGGGGELYFAE